MTRTGSTFATGVRTVHIHNGPRGARGYPGPDGEQGEQGDSINVLGSWASGTTYCPLDAVTYRSSLMDGVDSLYVQLSTYPCEASTLPPNEDPARWDELGAVSFGNAFGGIWEVYQYDHGFEYVGTPVAFATGSASYVKATASDAVELGICVVREIVDKDRVVLQSTGEIPFIDSRVIYPEASNWAVGMVYYVSIYRGRLEASPPTQEGSYSNPILIATDEPSPGARNGVALPWTPQGGAANAHRVFVGFDRFYYTATAGQTVFTGADRNGNTLAFTDADNVDVFVQGLNLDDLAYTSTAPDTVTLTTGAADGDVVEIWVTEAVQDLVVPSTVAKLDSIEGLFDGGRTTFPLTVASVPVSEVIATNVMIYLDMHIQEAGVDYTIIEDPDNAPNKAIQFAGGIPGSTRFYGLIFEPTVAAGVQATIASLEARIAALEAP